MNPRLIFLTCLVATSLTALANDRPLHAMDTCTKVHYPRSDVHSPEQQLDWLRQYGYAGIAWTEEDPAVVAQVAKAAQQRGMPMSAIYLSATLTRDGLRTDPRFPAMVEALKDHGTLLWLHIGSKDYAPSDPAGDAVAVPELRRLAEFAAARNLRLAIYPHFKDWTERTADAIRLVKAVGNDHFGVNFNLCHALMTGDEAQIPALLKEAAPKLFSVTVNGAESGAANKSWQQLIQPLGQGNYDVAKLLQELDRLGYQGPIFQQGYGIGQPPEDLLAASMHAWRTQIAGGWQDYQVIMWTGDSASKQPSKWPLYFQRLRDMGVTAGMVHGDGDLQPLLDAKFPYYVENIVNRGLCLKWNSNVRDWDKFVTGWKDRRDEAGMVRDISLDDPKWREWAHRQVASLVKKNAPHAPLLYELRDELSTTISANPFDYDFSPTALRRRTGGSGKPENGGLGRKIPE